MDIYIYKHTSPSGKHYIGQTVNIKNRWKPSAYKQCHKFYRAIEKYGWENITHEIICVCHTPHEANEKEMFYIQHYDSINNGYNILVGGGDVLYGENNPMYGKSVKSFMSEDKIAEWKRHLSEARKGESNSFYGKHHSEETKEKLRQQRIGVSRPLNLTKEQRQRRSELSKAQWTDKRRKEQSEKMMGSNNPMYGKHLTEEEKQKKHDAMIGENSPMAKSIIIYDTYEDKEILCNCRRYVKDEIGMHPSHVTRYLNKDKLYKERYLLREVV